MKKILDKCKQAQTNTNSNKQRHKVVKEYSYTSVGPNMRSLGASYPKTYSPIGKGRFEKGLGKARKSWKG